MRLIIPVKKKKRHLEITIIKNKKKMLPKQKALTITIKEVKGTTAKQTHQSKRLKAITLKKDGIIS